MMRNYKLAVLLLLSAPAGFMPTTAADPPTEWIDPDTGHRIVRLSREPGSQSLYFHQNASPATQRLVGSFQCFAGWYALRRRWRRQ
jgi:oligogalacturonide lyase